MVRRPHCDGPTAQDIASAPPIAQGAPTKLAESSTAAVCKYSLCRTADCVGGGRGREVRFMDIVCGAGAMPCRASVEICETGGSWWMGRV